MRKPSGVIEIFLQPGELYFGDRYTRLRTLLGSCVSLVFWHPTLLLGGMCHFMLPSRSRPRSGALDGRYGDEAVALLLHEIADVGARPTDFRVRIFGGGDMFPKLSAKGGRRIGSANVEIAHHLVEAYGLNCVASHVEGIGHRHLLFDIWTGRVTLRQALPAGADAPPARRHLNQ